MGGGSIPERRGQVPASHGGWVEVNPANGVRRGSYKLQLQSFISNNAARPTRRRRQILEPAIPCGFNCDGLRFGLPMSPRRLELAVLLPLARARPLLLQSSTKLVAPPREQSPEKKEKLEFSAVR